MALPGFTSITKGLEIFDKNGTGFTIQIFVSNGSPDGAESADQGSLCIDVTNYTLYINTDGSTTWIALDTGGGSAAEEGFIRAFIGKTAAGSELPDYTTNNWITDGDNLEVAIGKIDTKLGAAFTALTRTLEQFDPANETIMELFEHIDNAIGADTDMTSTNYIALANNLYENLAALDAQVKINTDNIAIGQHWREYCIGTTEDAGLNAAADGTALSTLLPFSDDDDGKLPIGAFSDGDYLLSKNTSGTDKLFLVYDDAGTLRVTTSGIDPLAEGDTFLCKYYLPDPSGGENSAIVWYDGTDLIKIADVDWQLATGINLSSAYVAAAVAAAPVAGDTVETAISKLHKDINDLHTLTGRPRGSTHMGTYTGEILTDDQSIKTNIQELETALEVGGVEQTASGVGSTDVTLDSVPIASVDVAHWVVYCESVSDPTKRYATTVRAMHDGTTNVDVDESPFLIFPPIDLDISVDVNAGNMRLLVNSDTVGGVNVASVRWIALGL